MNCCLSVGKMQIWQLIKFRAVSVAARCSSLTLGGTNLYHGIHRYTHLRGSHNTHPSPYIYRLYISSLWTPARIGSVPHLRPMHYRYWAYGRCLVNVIERLDDYSYKAYKSKFTVIDRLDIILLWSLHTIIKIIHIVLDDFFIHTLSCCNYGGNVNAYSFIHRICIKFPPRCQTFW